MLLKYSVFLSLIFSFSLPAWSMDNSKEELGNRSVAPKKVVHSSQKIVEKGKKSHIPGYETYLICEYFEDIRPLTQSQFNIHQSSNDQKIGEILLQYYPQGGYYKTARKTPTLRLRQIEIKEPYRRQHHATRALETLFRQLRESELLPKATEIWLEYSTFYPFLTILYQNFGFQETHEQSFGETKVLKVNLFKTKFPYYTKMKKETTTHEKGKLGNTPPQ